MTEPLPRMSTEGTSAEERLRQAHEIIVHDLREDLTRAIDERDALQADLDAIEAMLSEGGHL